MNTSRYRLIAIAIIGSLVAISACIPAYFGTGESAIIGAATLEATVEGTAILEPACIKQLMSGTAEAVEATSEPTLDSTEAATLESTQAANGADTSVNTALSYITLEPFDVRFNPNLDKAFAVVMN